MEQRVKNNPTKIATKWALINAAALIVITYAYEFLNVDQTSSVWAYLSYIPFIAFLFLTQTEFKEELGGYLSFGDGFSAGFRYSMFTGILAALFIYVYYSYLSPDVYERILESSRGILEKQGLSDEQIEQGMQTAQKYGPVSGAFGVAIGYAIFGAIVSLIGAAIFKKVKSPYDIANDAVDPNDPTV